VDFADSASRLGEDSAFARSCASCADRLPAPCDVCTVRALTICAPLTVAELHEVSRSVTAVTLARGETLFDVGDPAAHAFNLTIGALMLSRLLADGRRQVTGFLFPGDFLGLGEEERHRCTAIALVPTRLCRFARADFARLLDRHPDMERQLLRVASQEIAAAQDQMVLLGRKTAQEKVASFLLLLSRRAAQRGQRPDPVQLPMGRAAIADHLGLTIETVSRVIGGLRRRRLIALRPGGAVALLDRPALEALAGED
jgi:CRP/FNR family transcriptional regulator